MDIFTYVKKEFVLFITALVAPTITMLILIGLMIMADTITGIYAAIHKGGWDAFLSRVTSNRLLPKILFYPAAILLSQAMESQYPIIPFMKTTGFLIMGLEARSLGEHYKAIFGISFWDSLQRIVQTKDIAEVVEGYKKSKNSKPK